MKPNLSALLSFLTFLGVLSETLFADPLPDTVQISEPAGRGTRAMDYAPDGTLGMILLESNRDGVPASTDEGLFDQLVYRERPPEGELGSSEVIIGPEPGYQYGGSPLYDDAALFFDSSGVPHVYLLQYDEIQHYSKVGGEWTFIESVDPGTSYGFFEMGAAKGADGSIHFVLENSAFFDGVRSFIYAKRDSAGDWTWDTIVDEIENFNEWGPLETVDIDDHRPRNLSIGVDSSGHAHIAFSYDQTKMPVNGYTAIRSSLFYATNETGSWVIETLLSPLPGYGDYGGLACSIAVTPNDTVAVAALVIPRPNTGSPLTSWLSYQFRNPDKTWTTESVASSSAGYFGGDGDKGTGMNPLLVFDNLSRPHIVFTDVATTHYPYHGAFTFTGQVRYATRPSATGGAWDLRRVISANGASPEVFKNFEPAVAAYGDEFVVSAVTYTWDASAGEYGAYIPTFHFLENPSDIPYIAPPDTDLLLKSKTNRKIKKLKAKIKKAKKAGDFSKAKKLKGKLKKLKKLARSL